MGNMELKKERFLAVSSGQEGRQAKNQELRKSGSADRENS
jgi:hypothetical protein